jgi:hypothetical protein
LAEWRLTIGGLTIGGLTIGGLQDWLIAGLVDWRSQVFGDSRQPQQSPTN